MFEVKRLEAYNNPTVSDLYKIRDQIDMEPYYQRYGGIWDGDKKRLLIDTIINGYDIPKFYFHYLVESTDDLNSSGKKFAVIDGKQRLQAIFEFMDGLLKLDETVVYLKDDTLSLNGKTYSSLSKDPIYYPVKRAIDQFIFDIVHIVTDESDRIEEMFLRLNEGKPVNNAEKRNAIGGYLMSRINRIVDEIPFFTKSVRFRNRRMEHQDLLTKLILVESNNSLVSFTKESLDGLIKSNKTKNKDIDNAINNCLTVLGDLSNLLNAQDKLLRYKGIVPLYYWLYKQHGSNKTLLINFLKNFETARENNRKISTTGKANRTLLQFDRLNQQGAHQLKSLEARYRIFEAFYDGFKSTKAIDLKLELRDLIKEDLQPTEEV